MASLGTLFVISLTAVLIFFLNSNSEPIKNNTGDYTGSLNDLPADAQGDVMGEIYFQENDLTLKVGETRSVTVINKTNSQGSYIWESSNTAVAIAEDGTVMGISEGSCDISVKISGTDHSAQLRVYVEPESDKTLESNINHEVKIEDGLTYIDGILIANKSYSLPADYDPGVNQEALDAFNEMASDAANEGLDIHISSAYRSYHDQERIYNRYVEDDGAELADTYSSRPGHSDHQTGLAFDLNSIDDSFGDTPESDWVAENAHKYGFIIRFPKGKDKYTGYQYEPWHIRYLGVDKATEVYKSGLSLEEFLGIESVYRE